MDNDFLNEFVRAFQEAELHLAYVSSERGDFDPPDRILGLDSLLMGVQDYTLKNHKDTGKMMIISPPRNESEHAGLILVHSSNNSPVFNLYNSLASISLSFNYRDRRFHTKIYHRFNEGIINSLSDSVTLEEIDIRGKNMVAPPSG